MAEAIFFDVLPKFGYAAMEAGLSKFKASATDAGKAAGASLSGETDTALKKIQASYTAAANTASKAAADFTRANGSIGTSAQKAAESAGLVEVRIKQLAEALGTYGAGTSEVVAAENRLQAAWARSDTAIHAHALAFNEANGAMARNTEAAAAATAAQTRMTEAHAANAAAVTATGRTLNTVGAVSAVAFTAAMYESAKAAGDFQASQTRLVSSAGETSQGMKIVSDGILQLAGTVGYSAEELSKGMYTVESAGFRGADGLKVMTAAAQGAKAENADLTKVNDGLTTSLTDFHLGPEQAATVMSKLVTAVGESKVNFEQFTGSLHSVEPAAAAAKISLDDVYGTLARMTQSGMSADQATENMRNAINSLAAPNAQQAAAMAQFGISADDVSQKLGQRGLAGTMQYLSEMIIKQMDPAGNVSVSALNENAQAAQNAADMMKLMSPAARQVAQDFANGAISRKDFTGAVKASNATDAAQLSQFGALELKLDGFSKQYKNGRELTETYMNALKQLTGTVAGQSVALQVSGENAEKANTAIQAIRDTTTDADGKVKGFAETQETLNAKMADAKAAFGAAAIQLGNVFIPTLTDAATGLANVGTFLAEHKTLLDAVVLSVGALGTVWAATKVAMAVGNTFSAIAGGLDILIAKLGGTAVAYEGVTVAANSAAAAEARAAGASITGAGLLAAAGGVGALAAGSVVASNAFNSWSDAHPDVQRRDENGKIVRGRESGGGGQFSGAVQVGPLPDLPATQGAGAQAERQGGRTHDYGIAPDAPDADALAAAAAAAANPRPDITDPNAVLAPQDAAAAAKAAKAPAGDKNDPVWISSADGAKGQSADTYNPFAQFQTGGFTPASLVGFAVTFALNQALGNPYGKQLAAQKRGESPDSPMYVSSVDVEKAQQGLNDAIRNNGPDSTQAQSAAAKLAGTQAAVGTTGGYFDPHTGGLSSRDPSKMVDPSSGRMVSNPDYGTTAPTAAAYTGPGGLNLSTIPVAAQKYANDCIDASARIILSHSGVNMSEDQLKNVITPGGSIDSQAAGLNQLNPQGGYRAMQGSGGSQQAMFAAIKASIDNGTGSILNVAPGSSLAGHTFAPGHFIATTGYNPDGTLNVSDTAGGRTYSVSQADAFQATRGRGIVAGTGVGPAPAGRAAAPALGPIAAANDPGPGSLRDLFTGGGGLGPMFRQSPPPPPPRPGTGPSPFAPGGALSAMPNTDRFGGIGQPSRGGGAAPGMIGPFAVPGQVAAASRGLAGGSAGRGLQGANMGGYRAAPTAPGGGAPPATTPMPTPGGGRPASGGTGKGASSSIASNAAGALGGVIPGAAQAGQLIDRAIGYVGQLAGIGIGGLFETFGLNDSALADPSHSLIGRVAGGFAGAHKSAPNVAGTTAPPLKPPDPPQGSPASGNGSGPAPGPGAPLIGTQIIQHTGDPNGQRVASEIDRHLSSKNAGSTR